MVTTMLPLKTQLSGKFILSIGHLLTDTGFPMPMLFYCTFSIGALSLLRKAEARTTWLWEDENDQKKGAFTEIMSYLLNKKAKMH